MSSARSFVRYLRIYHHSRRLILIRSIIRPETSIANLRRPPVAILHRRSSMRDRLREHVDWRPMWQLSLYGSTLPAVTVTSYQPFCLHLKCFHCNVICEHDETDYNKNPNIQAKKNMKCRCCICCVPYAVFNIWYIINLDSQCESVFVFLLTCRLRPMQQWSYLLPIQCRQTLYGCCRCNYFLSPSSGIYTEAFSPCSPCGCVLHSCMSTIPWLTV
jgi:hypothetical protein